MLSPVVVFAYNRPHHLQSTLDALNDNKLAGESELFVFVDGAKNEQDREKVEETRKVLRDFEAKSRFKSVEITASDRNKGLANSVISGVTKVLEKQESVIVLEDDLVVSTDFLQYMNDCLAYYRDDERIGAISGYTPEFETPSTYRHDLFLSKRGNSWGWATWRNVWEKTDWEVSDFDTFMKNRKSRKQFAATQYRAVEMLREQMEGKIDSWAIRWDYSFFVRGLYTLYPIRTKVVNIGLDGSGTHRVNEGRKDMTAYDSHYTLQRLEADDRMIKLSSENRSRLEEIRRRIARRLGTGV